MEKSKYIWITDTHIHFWNVQNLLLKILIEKPKGIFISGDITDGFDLSYVLEFLAKMLDKPIYFILGNHDYYTSSIEKVRDKVRKLCFQYKNLIWLQEADVIKLSEDVCLIGADGWYDGEHGDISHLNYTVDAFLIEDIRKLKKISDKIDLFKKLSSESSDIIINNIKKANNYKTIYCLTHMPPWKEASKSASVLFDGFWIPYNTNSHLGRKLEEEMALKNQNLIVCSGHTHCKTKIRVSSNIECCVGGSGNNLEIIYL